MSRFIWPKALKGNRIMLDTLKKSTVYVLFMTHVVGNLRKLGAAYFSFLRNHLSYESTLMICAMTAVGLMLFTSWAPWALYAVIGIAVFAGVSASAFN